MKKKQIARLALNKKTLTNLKDQAANIRGGIGILSIGFKCSVDNTCTRMTERADGGICQMCEILSEGPNCPHPF
jgi:hypothetical protein